MFLASYMKSSCKMWTNIVKVDKSRLINYDCYHKVEQDEFIYRGMVKTELANVPILNVWA
jgi:hypothetical protein